MATVAHTIYSHYSPQDKEPEAASLSDGEQVDPAQAWQEEASRISGRHYAPPPNFVPATISYDDWGAKQASSSNPPRDNPLGSNLSGWYRSLTNSHSARASPSSAVAGSTHCILSVASGSTTPSTSSILKTERSNKNNWFIMKAIQSEPSSQSSDTPPPTLADILARDPPPLPSEGKYYPPVWLAIGPSNKGFSMLQQGGWNEGEPLGPDVVRRQPVKEMIPRNEAIAVKDKGKGKASRHHLQDHRKMEDCDDANVLRSVEVIDLTLSDSDDDDDTDVDQYQEEEALTTPLGNLPPVDASAHGGKALLTPIATVLKSDRLGIGLKAKTAGPYKASQKRVTHNAAAMAAHVRAAEESRKRKKEFGRGYRGFKRQGNKEEMRRKAMLAYLNT